MRYIRFLKTPRVVTEKNSSKKEIYCLITITSDLGDSFLPDDVQLSAELLSCQISKKVLVWRTIQWKSGMRSLPITFPLHRGHASSPLRVRIGVESRALYDEYGKLSDEGARGIVSAWSAEFNTSIEPREADKLIERQFMLPDGPTVSIWEETGESIARHLWDAGITFSCHIKDIVDEKTKLFKALLRPHRTSATPHVLELGTGCGMVGISLAQVLEGAKILLTDLPEAREIVERNMRKAITAKGASLEFQELDWDDELPLFLQSRVSPLDMVLAADCTYNPDSSPALVSTLTRLAKISPRVIVAIAMKMRHSSEDIFFDLMAAAGFQETTTITYPLPGDVEVGEETVYLHVYRLGTEHLQE